MPRLTEIGNIKLSIVTPLVQHIEINAKVTVGRASDAWQRARCTRTGQPGNIWLPTDVLTVNRPSRRKPAIKRTIFHAGLGLWELKLKMLPCINTFGPSIIAMAPIGALGIAT